MAKDYPPELCLPKPITEEWAAHLKNNFYANSKGQVFKKRNGFKEIGSVSSQGYRTVCLRLKGKQRNFKLSHLVWFLTKGVWPEKELDHISRDRLDNSIGNLREVTREENLAYRNVEQDIE